jgi:hypothetical protein
MELTQEQLANRVHWVEDLISGEFNQGKSALKRVSIKTGEATYCCLGVIGERLHLADIAQRNATTLNSTRSQGYLNPGSQELLGLSGDDQRTAAQWNDISEYPFNVIADYIAWATEHKTPFSEIPYNSIPDGYARIWLESQ